jgi:hypothetical protein
MKNGFKFFLAVVAFAFCNHAVATPFSCPNISEMKNIQLTRAMAGTNHIWAVTSEPVDAINPWNMVMIIVLPNAKSTQDAIIQAQDYLKTAPLLNPTLYVDKGISQCSYTSKDSGNAGIWAVNPPQYPPFKFF